MTATIRPAPVRKSIFVNAAPDRAFAVFTAGMGGWWLRTHSLTRAGQVSVTIEPAAGGRWFETGADGQECDWGKVRVWDPPGRVVLLWALNADWATEPPVDTEVEVTFRAEGSGTRVELEHRNLGSYGDRAAATAAILDSENGWGGLLAAFSRAA
jgi:uncharacterized protein YndB with AHSA1/START domain